MANRDQPYYRTGKICYIEIPAADVSVSADFYERAFGWHIRRRGDGTVAFDGTVGGVSGRWVADRPPTTTTPGLMVHIMVADTRRAVEAVAAAGGEIVRSVHVVSGETLAAFRDPGGNVLGIYQQPGLAEVEAAGEG